MHQILDGYLPRVLLVCKILIRTTHEAVIVVRILLFLETLLKLLDKGLDRLVVLFTLLSVKAIQKLGEVLTEGDIVYVFQVVALRVHTVVIDLHKIADEPHLTYNALTDRLEDSEVVKALHVLSVLG